ncbi:MAG: hypothetical protein K8R76_12170 [Candidatus Aegiribacteria sp.]|nr:hypothetical protein [Candidatus Aegiribacteria sp.]
MTSVQEFSSGIVLIITLAFLFGCHQVAEFETGATSGVSFVRTSDYTVETVVSGLEGARSICSNGNNEFLVATTEGVLYRVNSQSMVVESSFLIGIPSGSGYSEIIRSTQDNSIYILGPAGKIIEWSLNHNYVIDEFYTGPNPVDICVSPDGSNHIFVIDSGDQTIRKVMTSSNTVIEESNLYHTPSSVSGYTACPEFVLVACSDDTGSVCLLDVETLNLHTATFTGMPCGEITSSQNDSVFCIIHPGTGSSDGGATLVRARPVPEYMEYFPIAGTPVSLCSYPYGSYFYIASLKDGDTVITVLNGDTFQAETEFTIDGFPFDITTHRNGEYLLVLTSD